MSGSVAAAADLLYSEVEEDLRASVRSLLDKLADWPAVLARTESPEQTDLQLWKALAQDIGCSALAVPEAHSGAGASWREVAVVAEELGRAVAPVPFLGSAVVATATLLELVERRAAAQLLSDLADGSRIATLVVPAGSAPGTASVRDLTCDQDRVTGTVRSVLDAEAADVLLVPLDTGLYAVDSATGGVQRSAVVSLDMTRPLADISFVDAPAVLLAESGAARSAVSRGLQIGSALLSSEQLGLAERCFGVTLDYVKLRHQFGRPIGSFQAIKHRLADVWVLLNEARAVARYAAVCAADGAADLPVATAVASAHCSTVAQLAAEECMQLHGGIGFTWEHPAHLYLKRAKADSLLFGTAADHRAELGRLLQIVGASS